MQAREHIVMPKIAEKLNLSLFDRYMIDTATRTCILSQINSLVFPDELMTPQDAFDYFKITLPYYLLCDHQSDSMYCIALDPKFVINSGRIATLYLGQNIKTGEFVAVKTYPFDTKQITKDGHPRVNKMVDCLQATNCYINHYFLSEKCISRNLLGPDKPFNFIIIERLHDGNSFETILQMMDADTKLSNKEKALKILSIFILAFDVLKEFNREFTHNDMQLGNILYLEEQNKCVLIDFELTLKKPDSDKKDMRSMIDNFKEMVSCLISDTKMRSQLLEKMDALGEKNHDDVIKHLKAIKSQLENLVLKTNISSRFFNQKFLASLQEFAGEVKHVIGYK